jgi:carbonic anhydrase
MTSRTPPNSVECQCGQPGRSLLAASLGRRTLLRRTGHGAATAVAAGLIAPRRAVAQSTMSPDAALAELVAGNRRFADNHLESFDDDLEILRHKTVEKQEPFAAVLSCSDSRVPVELVFDQTVGHIFVARVAGNVASTDVIASLEYGVAVLGTKVIMVMGHANCGAAKAAIAAKAVPGQISALYRYIRPAVDRAGSDVDAVARANAQIQARILREASPVIADAIRQGQLLVVAGFYELASGSVAVLS